MSRSKPTSNSIIDVVNGICKCCVRNTITNYRIDFIYYRGKGVTPLRYVCNDARYDGFFASDHFPVWVDFEIQ